MLPKVLKNLRKKLDPFHHEQDLVQRTKNQELKSLVARLKKSKEKKQSDELIKRITKNAPKITKKKIAKKVPSQQKGVLKAELDEWLRKEEMKSLVRKRTKKQK
jgi:hypothetical protein